VTTVVRVNQPDTGDRTLVSAATAGYRGTCIGVCTLSTTVAIVIPPAIQPPVIVPAIDPIIVPAVVPDAVSVTGVDAARPLRLLLLFVLTGIVLLTFGRRQKI
jgi:hypothetical protein